MVARLAAEHMDGGVVIQGARDCIPNTRFGGEFEEAWRRVSEDPSWMRSCNHMWHLISEKLTELKETRDQGAGIVLRAPAVDSGLGFDGYGYGYGPPAATGPGFRPQAQGIHAGAAPLLLKSVHEPLGRMEDRGTDESRRTARDQFKTPAQPRRPEEHTDVGGARILKAKEAYMTRPLAPPQARDRGSELKINGVRKDIVRDDGKKGKEVEVRKSSAMGGRWKGVVEERKGVVEDRKGLPEDRRGAGEERRGVVEERTESGSGSGEDRRGLVEERQGIGEERRGTEMGEERQRMEEERDMNMEESMAQGREVGEKRKRDGDAERKQGSEKRNRDSDGEGMSAPKDAPKNEKYQVVLFKTEGGRAVHVESMNESADQKSDLLVPTTDPFRGEETSQEAGNPAANEGVENVLPEEKDDKDEDISEPQVVICNRQDMPTSSAGDPLPIKRKRRIDEVMEDGKPAKQNGQTFRAEKRLREVHQQPPVPVQDAKAKTTIADGVIASKARAPAVSVTLAKAKVTASETVIPAKTKSHAVEIVSFDKIKKKKKPDAEEPELEFKCGCTSKEHGDKIGKLKVFKSGELVIFCECKPGCPEAGKPLSPSAFERHAGRGAAKKWKNTIWLVVGNDKVPLYKVKAMEPYIEKNKGRKALTKT